MSSLKIYNTISRKIENFEPINPPNVGMYTCGVTVYDYTHIGHLRKYTNDDILKRTLIANGYKVKHVMNVTDVGHLVSDEDTGEDKMEKGARQRQMTVWEVARFFEDYFLKSIEKMNILLPNILARATEHVDEQIKLIQKLEGNGYIYKTDQAIYFDVSKFSDYTKLSRQKLEEKEVGVRDEVIVDRSKKHPYDFALWFFKTGHFKDHQMHWPSPWGEGFPGWHIECSAMSMEYLGNSFDIHTGGVEHIAVHHTNEIAQSEAATGEPFVKYWVHNEFLTVNGEKMSKSLKNFYTIDDLIERGFDPLALRYLFLTGHYRDRLNFTWESLQSAQNALNNLRETVRSWKESTEISSGYFSQFLEAMNNDLNASQALAVMWNMVKSDLDSSSKSATLMKMDQVLGLGLEEYISNPLEIPENVLALVQEREDARKSKDFKKSDKLRTEIQKLGYEVMDTSEGPKVKHI